MVVLMSSQLFQLTENGTCMCIMVALLFDLSLNVLSSLSSLPPPPPPPYSSEPLFLLAVPCESGICNGSTVTLQPQRGLLPHVGNTSHITIFDLWEDVRAVK